MQASTQIRESISRVVALRQKVADQPDLALALHTIKHVQAQRFAGTYQDLLHSASYAACANFFLEELYSAKDFAERDAQFARIAGALERTFPQQVVATAVALAELHHLTEELDLAMALNWQRQAGLSEAQTYVLAWRNVGRRQDRLWQLQTVLDIGLELGQLTRKPGLYFMLKMMRKPAQLAGLGSLQHFLESGFRHFADLARNQGTVSSFLDTVKARESAWLDRLFDAPAATCSAELSRTLAAAATDRT
ncbi:FFLEELY motif protein [Rhodoferax sp.]|jgi:hypothetical protein|uniref:FFLEELY motif protein n=1 Tax=Rhodoferax sp. TaxID=50421 RepID=UPI00271AC05E|nr:hypothetical protein [Rhodoferax sp.]MDO9142700.1 hypothetical protein [Rhodoferax sp.]MDP1528285.1 hypothetical protein [Rhodoferax sp.]MDP1944984.1 hypothetical protein [Rhodoferax sp.]MDP2443025.1 hypothetical protein [Rhodoferax sp.]MDP3191758.1 hypothetical protein [Rhodoferax sp.]